MMGAAFSGLSERSLLDEVGVTFFPIDNGFERVAGP